MVNFFKQRLWDMEWTVAIRPHVEDGMFDQPMQFRTLKNTWRYWCADPFVFDYEGKSYVFMEVADKLTQKGAIGYRVIDQGKAGPIRICIKTPHHMSYPMIFTRGNEIYMIPECHESEKMTIYRATQFPDVWESVEVVLENQKVCDTNYLKVDGEEYLLTMPLSGSKYRYDTLVLYRYNGKNWERCPVSPIVLGEEKARNGGGFFTCGAQLIRPSQNCGSSYGEKLVLNRVRRIAPDLYEEEVWKEITVGDVRTDGAGFDGIHTFNCSASYDVIDLRRELVFQPAKLVYFLRHKLRRGK